MAVIENHIKRISDKLQQLLKQYQQLQKENERLKTAVQKFESDQQAATRQVELLQLQAGILKAFAKDSSAIPDLPFHLGYHWQSKKDLLIYAAKKQIKK